MQILVTGTAGFIGFHLANLLVREGHHVTGLDNINDYYDVNLKIARLQESGIPTDTIEYNKLITSNKNPLYQFIKLNLEDRENIQHVFSTKRFDAVCNLAAQAGVRYSLTNPFVYINSNVVGFINILEACKNHHIKHLLYASSSSVYGLNGSIPFSEKDNVDHPISLYAATKKSNELMAHTYSYLYELPTTGLRFFTVYGPWGRPDMALFIFTKAILEKKPIQVYNNGEMERDFTYIEDITNGIYHILTGDPPKGNTGWDAENPDPSCSIAPYRIFNIGNSKPVNLLHFIKAIEKETGMQAIIEYMPMQPGDVKRTWADVTELSSCFSFKPVHNVQYGINQFVKWYLEYYNQDRPAKN